METPESIKQYEENYKKDAWADYTIAELGQWVHLLVLRAEMRNDWAKSQKDLTDAQNYLNMMQAKIDAVRG